MDWGSAWGSHGSAAENRRAPTGGALWRPRGDANIGPQIELSLVGKGYRITQPTYSLTYLDVPVLLRMRLGADARSTRVLFDAGPSFAVLLHCAVKAPPFIDRCDQSIGGRPVGMRPFDVGVLLGVGIERQRASGTRVALAARLNYGVVDVDRAQGTGLNRSYSIVLQIFPARERSTTQ